MSTEEDGQTLTRKQLRELRLTGSTPVVGGEKADNAPPAQIERPTVGLTDAGDQPAEGKDAAGARSAGEQSAPSAVPSGAPSAPLTRRAARARERSRTGAVPAVPGEQHNSADVPAAAQPATADAVVEASVVDDVDASVVEELIVEELIVDTPDAAAETVSADEGESSIPVFTPHSVQPAEEGAAETDSEPERPMVGAAFGIGVKRSPSGPGVPTAFDDLLETGSAGSHKTASTLIFTPSPDAGSLSGPVASTGELLITGTYALPEGVGSQGHALGTTDGKDVDAVLIDGELAPASSPTPIAASSAISTSKPAGEVIRPPVPDKGSKLTLTLAIVAGGLALALAAALIIAFTTGVLG